MVDNNEISYSEVCIIREDFIKVVTSLR